MNRVMSSAEKDCHPSWNIVSRSFCFLLRRKLPSLIHLELLPSTNYRGKLSNISAFQFEGIGIKYVFTRLDIKRVITKLYPSLLKILNKLLNLNKIADEKTIQPNPHLSYPQIPPQSCIILNNNIFLTLSLPGIFTEWNYSFGMDLSLRVT